MFKLILNSKSAISPIIGITLLLLVLIVSVTGFSSWFSNLSDSLLINSKSTNSNSGSVNILGITDNELFLKSNGNPGIQSIKINDNDCNFNGSISGINKINVSNCIENLSGTIDIIVISNNDLIQKNFYLEVKPPLDCTQLNGGEWIYVPGNNELNTEEFCVMKYEAKNILNDPVSQPALTPWVSISQNQAKIECSDLGVGYSLIHYSQRVTISRIIENDPTNWANGIIGSTVSPDNGGIYRGYVHENTSVGCGNGFGTIDALTPGIDCVVNSRNKRTLNILDNQIWDFSGNVFELSDGFLPTTGPINSSLSIGSSQGWTSWQAISPDYDFLGPKNTSLSRSHGIGDVWYDGNLANDGSSNHVLDWGGHYNYGYGPAGIYTLVTNKGPSDTSGYSGFRCTYKE